MFPEGEQRGPLPHRRRDALVLPRASTATSRATGDRDTLRAAAARRCSTSSSTTCAGTRFGIGVDPADGLLRQGAAGLPAHLDGREGRRLGGDAAPRQGGRDQRALVQRAAAARGLAAARSRRPDAARPLAARADAGPRRRSTRRFWYADGGYLYDVVDGENGRRPGLPAEPALRHLARAPGARPRRAGRRSCAVGRRAPADAGRPALAGARPPRLQGDATTAICARATRPTTRARSGPG